MTIYCDLLIDRLSHWEGNLGREKFDRSLTETFYNRCDFYFTVIDDLYKRNLMYTGIEYIHLRVFVIEKRKKQ